MNDRRDGNRPPRGTGQESEALGTVQRAGNQGHGHCQQWTESEGHRGWQRAQAEAKAGSGLEAPVKGIGKTGPGGGLTMIAIVVALAVAVARSTARGTSRHWA